MATSCQYDRDTGLTTYTLSIVARQCSGTSLPVGYYVTTDIPRVGHERNRHALGVSYIYRSDTQANAEGYARSVVRMYANHPRLRYSFADGVFDGNARAAA